MDIDPSTIRSTTDLSGLVTSLSDDPISATTAIVIFSVLFLAFLGMFVYSLTSMIDKRPGATGPICGVVGIAFLVGAIVIPDALSPNYLKTRIAVCQAAAESMIAEQDPNLVHTRLREYRDENCSQDYLTALLSKVPEPQRQALAEILVPRKPEPNTNNAQESQDGITITTITGFLAAASGAF